MKKMMVLSLVFSVMSLGTAMANDANAMVDAKPKMVLEVSVKRLPQSAQ